MARKATNRIKLCTWCTKNPVEMFGMYDEDSNMCGVCLNTMKTKGSKALQGEWSRNTRTELDAHAADVLQPFRGDGTVNPNFVQAHGTDSISKNTGYTKEQIHENIERYG